MEGGGRSGPAVGPAGGGLVERSQGLGPGGWRRAPEQLACVLCTVQVRALLGTNSYELFTLDKLINKLLSHMRIMVQVRMPPPPALCPDVWY